MRPQESASAGPGGPQKPGGPQRQNELRVNRRIRVKEVFVITADGTKLGVVPTEDALKRAMEEGLDLVEVNPMSRPPVCKLMDYGKYKYDQKKKAAVAKKNQKVIEVKEVKLRPKTDDHDFDFKMEHIRRFIGEGNKAKVTIMFRGREITHPEIGKQVLDRVVDSLKDIAMMELFPRMEGRNMFMVLAPGKPGSKPMGPVTVANVPATPPPAPMPGGAPHQMGAPRPPQGGPPSMGAGRPMNPGIPSAPPAAPAASPAAPPAGK
jgi:translation initiation factor IF-3